MKTTTNSSSELRIVTGVGGVCEIGSCSAAAVGCCSVAPSPRKAVAAGWVHSASNSDAAGSHSDAECTHPAATAFLGDGATEQQPTAAALQLPISQTPPTPVTILSSDDELVVVSISTVPLSPTTASQRRSKPNHKSRL
ncbi:hypothetical protein CASFOL_023181 [Castilleja foliolosa]|uniref:Hydrophobin n=1 Tax=Castilleja foliolosa TaxID=1961234 RepID=A0ABD3CNN0_9LAMI